MDALNFRLIQIRESISRLSADFFVENPNVNVLGIIGVRNTITHDYGNVNFSVYKAVIEQDLQKLKKQLSTSLLSTKKKK
jgi:uncharacterized protein with HEPN domain